MLHGDELPPKLQPELPADQGAACVRGAVSEVRPVIGVQAEHRDVGGRAANVACKAHVRGTGETPGAPSAEMPGGLGQREEQGLSGRGSARLMVIEHDVPDINCGGATGSN